MRVLLFGFGEPASQLLGKLVEDPNYTVVGVVPRTMASTVDIDIDILPRKAKDWGIPILRTRSVNSGKFLSRLESLDLDLSLNWGHNQLFSCRLIDAAKIGCANIHPGLLPYGRGSGAVIGEILNGRIVVGQTVHLMNENFDQGIVYHQRCFTLNGDEYADQIEHIFHDGLVDFYFEGLEKIRLGAKGRGVKGFGTYYPKKPAGDEIIYWELDSTTIVKRIRLRSPRFPSLSFLTGSWERVYIWKVEPSDVEDYSFTVGQVIHRDRDRGVLVKTGDNAIWLTETSNVPSGARSRPSFPIGTTFVSNWIQELSCLRDEIQILRAELATPRSP